MQRLVDEAVGPAVARVFGVGRRPAAGRLPGGQRRRPHAAAGARPLHGRLARHPTAITPRRYVICPTAPPTRPTRRLAPPLATAGPAAPKPQVVTPSTIRTTEGGRNAVTNRVIVHFEGDGSGVAELSWGQAVDLVRHAGQSRLPADGGCPGAAAGSDRGGRRGRPELHRSRHQSLRTRLRFDPDGHTQQVVHASGEIALEVVDAGDGDPGEIAAAVAAGYKALPFDL